MKKFNLFKETYFAAESPVKTDLISVDKYKVATVGVETGVTISPCVMNSEMVFYVVEGSGSITAEAETISITQGDIIVVPPHVSRSISAHERLSLLAVQIHELPEGN